MKWMRLQTIFLNWLSIAQILMMEGACHVSLEFDIISAFVIVHLSAPVAQQKREEIKPYFSAKE